MSDLDEWKNYEDYNYEVEEKEEVEQRKREIILEATLPSVAIILILISFWVFKPQLVRLRIFVIALIIRVKLRLGLRTGRRMRASLDPIPYYSGTSLPNMNDVEAGSENSGIMASTPPPTTRYQSTRPLNLPIEQRGSLHHSALAEGLIQPFFARPLSNFGFSRSLPNLMVSTDSLEIVEGDFVTSTQLQQTHTLPHRSNVSDPTTTERSPLRCLYQRQRSCPDVIVTENPDGDSVDTLELMQPDTGLKQIDLTGDSVGSVVAIEDLLPRRQLPPRSTRNKCPIYVDDPTIYE